MMFKVIKNLYFCYGHRLLDHPGKCAHLHGHNAMVQVEFWAVKLNAMGMVIDFDDIKNWVQRYLDEELDHRMILHETDPFVDLLRQKDEPVVALKEKPTAENLAKVIFEFIRDQKLPVSRVRLWETPTSCAEYIGEEREYRR